MIITTTDLIPNKEYEILGVVFGNRLVSVTSKTEGEKAIKKMKSEAKDLNADAIVGVRSYTTKNGSTCFYGTAVKFI